MSETPRQRVQAELIRQSDEILAGVKPDEDSGRIAVVSAKFAMGLAEELDAMTAAKELAERELHNRTNSYLEHVRDLAIERDALKAAKELAERQVTLLAGTLAADINSYPCGSMAWSADQWVAWSRAEAEGGQ